MRSRHWKRKMTENSTIDPNREPAHECSKVPGRNPSGAKIWITGGAGSGKSSLAQELAAALSPNGKRYYVATMVPRDEEDRRRIRKHIEDRRGMGFETIECPCGLTEQIARTMGAAASEGTFLLDSMTALLANAMFGAGEWNYDPAAAEAVIDDLRAFAEMAGNLIVVSDGIYSDALLYDEMTEVYRKSLAGIERRAAGFFDTLVECAAGGMILHKGKLPATLAGERTEAVSGMELIIGGACQGKTEYAKEHYHLRDEEIFVCTQDREPDFEARAISHLERYLRKCAAEGTEPVSPDVFRRDAVILCDEITCGIVPVDALDRRWREMTGKYLSRLTRYGAGVTRVFCGLPQRLAEPVRTREIILVRHGRTIANEEHLYCGRTDLPLSEKGRRELVELAPLYAGYCTPGTSFYTSGMKRTDETLRILFGETDFHREAGLRELDFGAFEGRGFEELRTDPAYLKWISGDNERNTCPGGESGERMKERVLRTFERILEEDPAERIVIVTHGGPIAAILEELFPDEGGSRYDRQPACGESVVLQKDRRWTRI